jgi:hypothetical protein
VPVGKKGSLSPPTGLLATIGCNTSSVLDPSEGPALSQVQVQVPVDWSGLAEAPVHHVNQSLAQIGGPAQDGTPDGIYLALGSAEPPLVFGSDEERQRALEKLEALRISVHGRFHISRGQLKDLIEVLTAVATQYDGIVRNADGSHHKDAG